MLQGFNIWHRAFSDLSYWAVSDINVEELQEFGDKARSRSQERELIPPLNQSCFIA
jgi:hypothetical protein